MKFFGNSNQAGWSLPITWILLSVMLGVAFLFGWKALLYVGIFVVLIVVVVYFYEAYGNPYSGENTDGNGQSEDVTTLVSPQTNHTTREMGDIPVSDGYSLRVDHRDTESFSAVLIHVWQINDATLEERIGTAVGRLVPVGTESNAHWRVDLFVTTKRLEVEQVEGKWTRVAKDVRSLPPRLSNEIAVALKEEGLIAEPYIVWTANYTPLGDISAGTILDDD